MARVGRLNVQLGAELSPLKRDMGGAERLLGKFKKDVDKLGDASPLRHFSTSITKVAGGAGRLLGGLTKGLLGLGAAGAAAGIGLGVVAESQISLIGDQADAAKKLGLTRNELLTLQRAAKGVGIDSDKLTASFEKMSDVLGSAFRGDSGAVKTLEKLGLSVSDLQRMDPAARFMAIGRAVGSIDDPAKKIAAARDVFGKAGGDLIPMFEGGAGAIAGAYRELGLFGNLLSDLDLHGIESAGDAFDAFGTIVDGVKTRLAAEVAPVVVKIGEDTTAWIESMGGVGAIADGALVKLADGLEAVGNKISHVGALAKVMADEGSAIGATLAPAAPIAKALIPGGLGLGLAGKGIGALYDYGQEYVTDVSNSGEKRGKHAGISPKKKGLGTLAREYVDTARANNEDDAAGVPRRSESVVAESTPQKFSDWKRGRKRDPNLPKYDEKRPAGTPGYESKRLSDDPYMNKYESKRPGFKRDYEAKRPAIEAAIGGDPVVKAISQKGDPEVTALLKEIAKNTRTPGAGLLQ